MHVCIGLGLRFFERALPIITRCCSSCNQPQSCSRWPKVGQRRIWPVGTDKASRSALYCGHEILLSSHSTTVPDLSPVQSRLNVSKPFVVVIRFFPDLSTGHPPLSLLRGTFTPRVLLNSISLSSQHTTKRFNAKACFSAIDAPLHVPSHGSSEIRAGT